VNNVETTSPEERRRRRKRALLALGAGGLALGIGATVTLASWSDNEVANSDFAAGAFNIQGSADGSSFSDNPSAPGLTVSFDDLAAHLTPNDTSYAPYAIRLDPTANLSADVVLANSAATGAIAQHLSYSIYQTQGFGCSAAEAAAGTALVTNQPASVAAATGTLFSLASAGDVANLCIAVTADGALEQAQTGNIAWTFTGTSTAPTV